MPYIVVCVERPVRRRRERGEPHLVVDGQGRWLCDGGIGEDPPRWLRPLPMSVALEGWVSSFRLQHGPLRWPQSPLPASTRSVKGVCHDGCVLPSISIQAFSALDSACSFAAFMRGLLPLTWRLSTSSDAASTTESSIRGMASSTGAIAAATLLWTWSRSWSGATRVMNTAFDSSSKTKPRRLAPFAPAPQKA